MADSTVDMLEALVSGRIDLEEFRQRLSDELFELRQNATPTEVKKLLSRIQLYLHEFDEGDRDIHEVYMVAQAALYSAKPITPSFRGGTRIVFTPPSPRVEVVPTTFSPPPEFSELREVELV